MKKTSKIIALLIILAMAVTIMPINSAMAGITDNDTNDGNFNIIRKTTTNYFTTIKLEGGIDNQITGETLNFNKVSEEIAGNTTDENVAQVIQNFKNDFSAWATETNAINVTFSQEGITDYYYEAHDEITQSNNGSSDVILVGDPNDMDHAYSAQGQVTINTILDKHQTYTITANATIVDNRIKTVDVSVREPDAEDKIEVVQKTNTEYGFDYLEPSARPQVAIEDERVDYTYSCWITGTYTEMGDGYDELFEGTFEEDGYYYAEVGIIANEGYVFGENLVIKVNGETPAEVFGLYSDNTETHFIAKIKAKKRGNKEYTINKEDAILVFTDKEGHEFNAVVVDMWNVTDEELEMFEITREEYEEGKNLVLDILKDYKNIIKFYRIEVFEQNYSHTGKTIIKIKLTDELKKFNSFKMVNVNDDEPDLKLGEVVEGRIEGDYIIFELPHLSYYALVGEEVKEESKSNNPQTGDNIYIVLSIFIISALGAIATIKYKK